MSRDTAGAANREQPFDQSAAIHLALEFGSELLVVRDRADHVDNACNSGQNSSTPILAASSRIKSGQY
jgi:hypothetical protein